MGMTDVYTCEYISVWVMEENSKDTMAHIYSEGDFQVQKKLKGLFFSI